MARDFERNLIDLHGAQGESWLAELPARVAAFELRWGFRAGPPFDNLSYNYAAPAERLDGTPVVVKLGVPNPELRSEIEALRLYDGRGISRLLEAAPDEGALLLERLRPGAMLSTVADDEAATRIAAQVMTKLWRPAPAEHHFPTVGDWAAGLQRLRAMFDGGTGPLPAALIDAAEQYFAELPSRSAAPLLLHGDLHHYNILSAEREPWLAIDPKGLVGDPGYEVGALLHNPFDFLEAADPGRKLEGRVAVLSEVLGMERQAIAGWGVAVAMLSAWWSLDDHGQVDDNMLTCAGLLNELAP